MLWFFEEGLSEWLGLALSLQQSSCLYLSRTRITCVHCAHQVWLWVFMSPVNSKERVVELLP